MSEDSYRYSNKLTEAIDKIFEEQGIFAIRKQVSHDAKKLNPATALPVPVRFDSGSKNLKEHYAAYKEKVAKISGLRKKYNKAAGVAFPSSDPVLHQAAIDAANEWCEQATK